MRTRLRQAGASIVMVIVVLALSMAVIAALVVLQRQGERGDARAQATASLLRAQAALEQFAASAQRLPCPANPGDNTGLEVRAGAYGCADNFGTIPWKTIGMRFDDTLDPWGRKLSYRPYAGPLATGLRSLTQDGGLSMVQCDTVDTNIIASALTTLTTGLCVPNADVRQRTTSPAAFLAGKGMQITDFGVLRNDVAYVIFSHGPTGLGGYTPAGEKVTPDPKGDERANMNFAGPFTSKAFSSPDIAADADDHFDDIVVYARTEELIKRIGLGARNWPEDGALMDAATVGLAAGAGGPASPGDLGRNTLSFDANTMGLGGATTATAFSGGTATNFTFDLVDGVGGIGVAGGGFTGELGGQMVTIPANALSSLANESIRLSFTNASSRFAITLSDFGRPTYVGLPFTERVEFTFYKRQGDGSLQQVGSPLTRAACRGPDGILASYSFNTGLFSPFDVVQVRPLNAIPVTSPAAPSNFYIAAFGMCSPNPLAICATTLTTVDNTCT